MSCQMNTICRAREPEKATFKRLLSEFKYNFADKKRKLEKVVECSNYKGFFFKQKLLAITKKNLLPVTRHHVHPL